MCLSMDVWHVQSVVGHVTVYGHVIVLGHVFGYVTWKVLQDHVMGHVMGHMMFPWDHVPVSQDHVGVSLSSLSGYSLALGVSRVIPS